jgi:hypothetical protein
LIVLKRQGSKYEPQLVLMLAVSNDFADRPAFLDQVDYLKGIHIFQEDLVSVLGSTAVERRALQQVRSGAAGAFLGGMTYLIKRSWIATSAARIVRQSRKNVPAGSTQKTDEVALSDPEATAKVVLQNYAFIREQTAAIKEVALTCRDVGIPFVLFTYRMGDSARSSHLRHQLGELASVHDLDYGAGADVSSMVNSPTDSHWNANGTRAFGRKMADVIAGVLTR